MKILALDANERGDLFTRLVADVFAAQGYENPRIDIDKTGREIDLKARHRLEPKQVVAECKATKEPVGGDVLNKFAGSLQLESSRGVSTQGYVVSLSGFRESARAQEEEADPPRFVLLDGDDVRDQLVAGNMVVAPDRAVEIGARLADPDGALRLHGMPELLGHQIGWIWLCVYERDHQPERFALIHADGVPLAAPLASEVIAADKANGGSLEQLEYCAPEATADAAIEEAERLYRAYLSAELGQITLEGLPADEEVGSRRIALEDLYVPLAVESFDPPERTEHPEDSGPDYEDLDSAELVDVLAAHDGDPEDEPLAIDSIGEVLGRHERVAILGGPGTGKSTLIKRLGVAYAVPGNRELVADDLPPTDWLPIFLRCRSLGSDSRQPIRQLLEEIPVRGEFPDLVDGFRALLGRALSEGRAMLLIDGLDEISDQGDRVAFVQQLRTFLGTYPNVRMVLTSRITGFRIVGGAMSGMCARYGLAEFDDDDIEHLTRAWHATVFGESGEIDRDAKKLAGEIVNDHRVRQLARNPLLLTTLLLVKRWVGKLPEKRAVLYDKAIEVLLMTWNVEAHRPIDLEEAVPQLAHVAYDLAARGTQSVNSGELTALLAQARREMPEIFGFARTTVAEFVDRIESRSSLLVMTGHVVEAGQLVPTYEFQHLTFQEYLAAVALVEGFYAGHRDEDKLADLLVGHASDPAWSEVIGLALVKAGRAAGDVIRALLAELRSALEDFEEVDDDLGPQPGRHPISQLLGNALADEVQLPPDLAEEVCRELRKTDEMPAISVTRSIFDSRYGEMLKRICIAEYVRSPESSIQRNTRQLADFVAAELGTLSVGPASDREVITALLASDDIGQQARGSVAAMSAAFRAVSKPVFLGMDADFTVAKLYPWATRLIELCQSPPLVVRFPAVWALSWLGEFEGIAPADRGPALKVLLAIWRGAESSGVQAHAAWAFSAVPEIPHECSPFVDADHPQLVRFVEEQVEIEPHPGRREDRRPAALLLAYYLGAPWSDDEIAERIADISKGRRNLRTITDIFRPEDDEPVTAGLP